MREEAIKKAEAETLGHAKARGQQLKELIGKMRAKANGMARKKQKVEVVDVKDEEGGCPEAPGAGGSNEAAAGSPRPQALGGAAAAVAAGVERRHGGAGVEGERKR